METNKIEKITMSLMESSGEPNDSEKADYIVRSTATIDVQEPVKKAIDEYGIENVLDAIYNDVLKENKEPVDSIGVWVKYDGKDYGTSVKLKMLSDMEKFSDEEIFPIFEIFKLMSPIKQDTLAEVINTKIKEKWEQRSSIVKGVVK
jgi:hypothetical protein